MNLLGAALYDPAGAVSKATSALLAMTALDTTNLRLAITVPAHGFVRFHMLCTVEGAATFPQIMLGVMNGAAIIGRVTPIGAPQGTALATTHMTVEADFTVTGLTPGAMNVDAAYAVETVVAATNIKYGGPNNTTGDDAWGAFVFEAFDPRPLPTAAPGANTGVLIAGTNTGPFTITGGVTFSNAAGSGFTCSSSGSNGDGITLAGNGTGKGMRSTGGATGQGIDVQGGATSGSGLRAMANGIGNGVQFSGAGGGDGLACNGQGAGAGLNLTAGATGLGVQITGGATSGDGIKVTTTNGHGLNLAPVGTNVHGIFCTGGNAGVSDGFKIVAGTGGVSLNATLSTLTTYTGNTPQTGDCFPRLPIRLTKNVAFNNFTFPMVSSSDHVTGVTALTVTATRTIDGAAFAACANAVTELSNGFYKINLATTDLNGDNIDFVFTAPGADPRRVKIVTQK